MKDDLQSIWNAQPTSGAPAPSVADVEKASRAFARKIAFRNARESLAAGIVMASFALMAARAQGNLVRAGCALVVLAAAWVSLVLYRRGRVTAAPRPDAPTAEHIAHYRAELDRQRALLSRVVWWYLAPFVPGLVVYAIGTAIEEMPRAASSVRVGVVVALIALTALVFAFVAALNRRAVAALGREIEALASGPDPS